jgi:hypothetical protein
VKRTLRLGRRRRASEASWTPTIDTRLTPDVVIAATGYRPVLEPLVGHLGVLGPAGLPTGARERSGLYFVGFPATLAGTFRDVDREARVIAAQAAGGRRARSIPGHLSPGVDARSGYLCCGMSGSGSADRPREIAVQPLTTLMPEATGRACVETPR